MKLPLDSNYFKLNNICLLLYQASKNVTNYNLGTSFITPQAIASIHYYFLWFQSYKFKYYIQTDLEFLQGGT